MEISIRHSEPNDFKAIKAIYQQPSCYGGTLQLPYPSDSLWQKRLSNDSDADFSLVALIDDEIVGQIGMGTYTNPRRKHVSHIGMGVSEAHQGQGIGHQLLAAMLDLADNWLAIRRVELQVYSDNLAAKALYQKHGFMVEGTAKDYAFRDGKYVTALLMARVK